MNPQKVLTIPWFLTLTTQNRVHRRSIPFFKAGRQKSEKVEKNRFLGIRSLRRFEKTNFLFFAVFVFQN
jgi:hypothetical protein